MLDRKNNLTITHIPQHKNNLSNNNSKNNQPKKNIQENFDWNNESLLMKISLIDNQIEMLSVTIDKIKKEIIEKL